MRTTILPFSVNLIALPTRLVKIWRSLTGSPRTGVPISDGKTALISSPFALARSANQAITSFTVATTSKGMHSIVSRPASIFERSRISFVIVSSAAADC